MRGLAALGLFQMKFGMTLATEADQIITGIRSSVRKKSLVMNV